MKYESFGFGVDKLREIDLFDIFKLTCDLFAQIIHVWPEKTITLELHRDIEQI